MKKGLILIVLAIVSMTYISCEKPKTEPEKDYREKWIGEYMGEYAWFFFAGYTNHEISNSDTINDAVLNVFILNDSCLHIINDGRVREVKINTDGYFKQCDDNHGHDFYNGNIRGDSIILSGYRYSSASSWHCSYKGKKSNK